MRTCKICTVSKRLKLFQQWSNSRGRGYRMVCKTCAGVRAPIHDAEPEQPLSPERGNLLHDLWRESIADEARREG